MEQYDRANGFRIAGEPHRFNHAELDRMLKHVNDIGASDIYFKTGRPVVARLHGRLVRLTSRHLEHAEVVAITCDMYGGANADLQLRTAKPIDQAYVLKLGRDQSIRFRWCATGVLVNGNFGISIVMRKLDGTPRKLDRDELDVTLLDALFPQDGLVLVAGETGAGKSTLLASVIREMMEDMESDRHIIEFAAPIEYVYDKIPTLACEVDQSAVPDHLGSFAAGVINSLRRDPDVIVVGESRDAETIKACILASQTGHAVYSTVHSNSVAATFLRLIQSLPAEEMHSIMGSIIDQIRVIVAQRLLPSLDGKRVAVREYLVFDNEMRRQLLSVASTNLMLLPVHAAKLVDQYGKSMLKHAQELADAGRISQTQVDLIRRSQEVQRALMGGTATAIGDSNGA